MFADVPEELEATVRNIPKEWHVPQTRYALAAGLVVRYYLGEAILKRRHDPFLRHGMPSWQFNARISQIGSDIFALRSEPGFSEMCRRMRERDLVSTHCELASAKRMKQYGFTVHAKPETYEKGSDFDYAITRGDTLANCEVTLLRPTKFTRNNVINALRHKRGQLPADAPAIIDIVYPFEHWSRQVKDIKAELFSISGEFFRGTGRINYVYFSNELFMTKKGGGGLLVDSQICWHENPRIVSPSLDAALRRYPPHHFDIEERMRAKEPDERGGVGEFSRWVNEVLGT